MGNRKLLTAAAKSIARAAGLGCRVCGAPPEIAIEDQPESFSYWCETHAPRPDEPATPAVRSPRSIVDATIGWVSFEGTKACVLLHLPTGESLKVAVAAEFARAAAEAVSSGRGILARLTIELIAFSDEEG